VVKYEGKFVFGVAYGTDSQETAIGQALFDQNPYFPYIFGVFPCLTAHDWVELAGSCDFSVPKNGKFWIFKSPVNWNPGTSVKR
jgi:hypothetical protein